MSGDEHQLTELYEEPTWIDPVQSREDLPPGKYLREGTLCFVESERAVYWYRGGEWQSRSAPPPQ